MKRWILRFRYAFELVLILMYDIIVSSVQIALLTLKPKSRLNPGLLDLPLEKGMKDIQIMVLSHLISMTPGILSVKLNRRHDSLLLHFLVVQEGSQLDLMRIKRLYEKRVNHVF